MVTSNASPISWCGRNRAISRNNLVKNLQLGKWKIIIKGSQNNNGTLLEENS